MSGSKRGFFERQGIVRHAIRKDLFFFAIPALVVFSLGLVLSAADGYPGFFATLWDLIRNPERLQLLTGRNIVGMALIGTGLTVAITGATNLGRFYSSTVVIREGHQLITRGLYRWTRNPVYLGALMVCAGVPLYASSLAGFLVMLLLIPLVLNRIRMEEGLLREEFGDAFRAYRESTSKLIPFVY